MPKIVKKAKKLTNSKGSTVVRGFRFRETLWNEFFAFCKANRRTPVAQLEIAMEKEIKS